MPATRPIATLEGILDYLDGLKERAPIGELRQRIAALHLARDDVAAFVRFSDTRYMRNLVRDGRWYHLLILCWRSGQRSPIHDHNGSTCGLRVLQGTATETTFEKSPCGLYKPTHSCDYSCGSVSASQDADVHQISNLQAPGEDLVTLHIYSPPLLRMQTYSMTESTVGEYRPVITEHIYGSGI